MTHGSRADGIFSSASRENADGERRRLRVDHRTLARDGDRLLNGRQFQFDVDLGANPAVMTIAFVDRFLEAGELERHRVGADRNARKTVAAAFDRDNGLRLNQGRTGEDDRDARQYSACAVGDLAVDFTCVDLRPCGRRDQQRQETRESCTMDTTAHSSSSRLVPQRTTTYKSDNRRRQTTATDNRRRALTSLKISPGNIKYEFTDVSQIKSASFNNLEYAILHGRAADVPVRGGDRRRCLLRHSKSRDFSPDPRPERSPRDDRYVARRRAGVRRWPRAHAEHRCRLRPSADASGSRTPTRS